MHAPFFPDGRVDIFGEPQMQNMLYKDFLGYVRSVLVAIGYSAEEAEMYATHSFRRGAATAATAAGVPAHVTMAQAGTVADGWISGYDELSDERRCDVVRAVGL